MLRAEGCLLCIALEAVEGVFEKADGEAAWPVLDWGAVSGLEAARTEAMPTEAAPTEAPERSSSSTLVLVRTASGPVALRVEACLGVREVSFLEHPPVPTHLTDPRGHPLCYLLHVDRRLHFLVEPGALAQALRTPRALAGASSNGAAPEPAATAAGV